MASTGILKDIASRLEVLTVQLLDAGKSVPDALIRPSLDLLGDQKQVIYELIAVAARGTVSPEITDIEIEIAELVKHQGAELDIEGGPWHNPPALRRFREMGQAVSKKLQHLNSRKAEAAAGPAGAPSMAAATGGYGGGADRNMSVEQALNMLVQRKEPVWKGSLIGIVHAAGVQELTAITSHLPGKFEFVYAPKVQAAWNLHQNSAVI